MNKNFILLKYFCVSLLYLTGCYEPLEIEKLCHPLSEACGNQDFDEDGVANQKDEFPFDKACSKNDVKNCGSCGKACEEGMFCNIDKICEMIKIEVCNGKDDDGNKIVDDLELSDLQEGVCKGSLRRCVDGIEQDADYFQIQSYQEVEDRCDRLDNDCDGIVDEEINLMPDEYQEVEDRCDGLDNDCDGKIDEGITFPLTTNQSGVCLGALKVCGGTEGFVDQYDIIELYQEVENRCDHLDNDCDG